ncbi:type II toxin-antitoxin system VapB family antitoxin [Streptomyces sp. NPDC002644]
MARTVIDLDDDIVTEAMRLYGTKTKAAAVRAAMEEAVKYRLRQEFFDALDRGDVDLTHDSREAATGPAGKAERGAA